MNCLCNFFEDNCLWILIIVLILVFWNNGGLCGNGCGNSCGQSNCGCGCC